MDMENLIGETTEYDKKAALEVKSPKAGARVSALLRTRWAVRLFSAWRMTGRSLG